MRGYCSPESSDVRFSFFHECFLGGRRGVASGLCFVRVVGGGFAPSCGCSVCSGCRLLAAAPRARLYCCLLNINIKYLFLKMPTTLLSAIPFPGVFVT